ncbi:DUF547 domain-containing protein [Ichthyenterobacterium sp. W332]|uniref:DUF547 domain-containing protein n=1 Tax=Microcosmobacter mediterraneus TaxID=3075607 RepID=A0ABU2YK36_9FLAO|nr:DUF547 domain-containing protein [Ichthyenterobacterium sp. W332]MDT0558511.1 DUF547 domain-containing protein [Ichthyenterobacterium sp. W332]
MIKQIAIALLIVSISSCNSSKKAIENETNDLLKSETNLDPKQDPKGGAFEPNSPSEIHDLKNNDSEIHEMVEIIDHEGNTVAEVSSHKEAKEIMKQRDSLNNGININQNVSKRFYENHELWSELLEKHVSNKGKVNYIGFKRDYKDLKIYIMMLKMGYSKIDEYSKDNKLAYWINAYNALTIDLILRNYPVSSIKDIKDPWKQRLWKFGDKWLNLDDIEHKIIRKMGEPRIHFALVCAAVSCPKLYNKAFTAATLDEDLTKLTKEFLADTSKNNIAKDELKLSKIFSWFAKDFKENGSLIDFLNNYTDIKISSKAKKRFNSYNWDLNE